MSAAEAIAPEQSVDKVRQSLSVTDKGKTANTIDNCRIVFCCDPLLRDAIRLNLLTDRVDIVQDLGWRRNTSALTDTDVKYLLLYFERNYELTSEKKITAALSIVANENCYHPIQDVLNSLVWDGTPRIRSCLHHFLGADESDYVEEMLKHFLLGAIRRVFRPGSKYEEMLCLVGGQGAGKSTFFRLLAIRDEWFSDDLKKLDDDRVFQKLQGHWIIEMSEMLATSSAKSIEEIRSFISRQKETYRTPYESQPKDRLRQCVFGGSSNTLDFLPLDRAGNRRFLPIMIYPEKAEVHILEDEDASRAYLLQVWAEAMSIYHSGKYSMKFSKSIQRQLVEVQKDFMPEDTEAGQIQGFLEHYTGNMVCSKQLFKEALGHTFDEPKRWQLHNINEIMNTVVTGWKPFSNPRMFAGYGRQKGWERDTCDVLFIYAFSILTTISCTTYVSISIEGKQIEILKSLPIAAKCLFRVKLLHHLSMSVPTIFVLNTIMALYLQWSFPKAMLGYAFPLLCSVLIGMIGYILNLIFPNFEWENVTHIIKQSLPAILTALIGVVVTCGTAYLLLRFFPSALFMGSWLACAIILLLLLTMVAWVDKKGQHLYQEL